MKKLLINSLDNFENSSQWEWKGNELEIQCLLPQMHCGSNMFITSMIDFSIYILSKEKLSGFLAWLCQSRRFPFYRGELLLSIAPFSPSSKFTEDSTFLATHCNIKKQS